MRDGTATVVVGRVVTALVDDVVVVDVVEVGVVEVGVVVDVAETIDVEDRGCCALYESRPVSMANPAAETRMIAVPTKRLIATGPRARPFRPTRFLLC
jgi:hypothetical protein